MAGLNKVMIIGNLGRDPEMRHTPDGTPVVTFSVATSRQWTSANGEKQEKIEWHRIVVWRKLAELCNQHLSKGRQVYIEGRLETKSWVGEGDITRYQTEVVAERVQFLGSKVGNNSGSYSDSLAKMEPPSEEDNSGKHDDIPF